MPSTVAKHQYIMLDPIFPYQEDQYPEITVSYAFDLPIAQRAKIHSSSEVVDILRHIYPSDALEYCELFYVLYFTRANDLIGYHLHSVGGLSSTTVDIKQMFGIAARVNAASLILSHSHPSGTITPSRADISITKKVVDAAALFDLTVLDHIILTKESFYSFTDDGTLPVSLKRTSMGVMAYYNSYPVSWDN